MKLLVATRSAHKLAEIRAILAPLAELELVSLDAVDVPPDPPDDVLEPFDTFEANARSKALWYAQHSGLPSVADDSGIEVDALDGAPGVRSKRFAPTADQGAARDRANNLHLLQLLNGVPEERRSARYVCAVAFVDPDATADAMARSQFTVRGTVEGRILEAPQGSGGFGYDPLFFVPDLGCTFAEASADEKHRRSHRGAAFRALLERLEAMDS